MRKFIWFLLLAAAPVFGAPKQEDWLAKSVQAAGGFKKFARMESLRYNYEAFRASPQGPEKTKGAHFIRLHDDGGLRVREEASTAKGRVVTVVISTGAWMWENGEPVADAARVEAARKDLLEKVHWVFTPFIWQEEGAAAAYDGLGYLEGKLAMRFSARRPDQGVPGFSHFTVYLNTATYQLEGAQFAHPSRGLTVMLLGDPLPVNGLLLSSRRAVVDNAGATLEGFVILKPEINIFIDENLFSSTAGDFTP